MSRVSIEFLGGHLWLTILLGLIFLAASFLYYRRTTPPLGPGMRRLLFALRGLALVMLFLSLTQPILSFSETSRLKKRMAVLLDRSASMNLPVRPPDQTSRLQQASELLTASTTAPLRDNLDVTYYAFAESLDVSDDGKNLSGKATDFGRAIKQLRQMMAVNPYDYVLVLSDGRATEGEDLADAAGALERPLFTIAVGDSGRIDDINLADVEYNDVMYVGRQSEIKANLSQQGRIDGRLQIQLSEGNTVLAQKTDDPPGDGRTGQYTLAFTPTKPGKSFLTVTVSAGNETNVDNNRRRFAVRVLKSKLNVLLYSSSLNQEYAFVNRYLAGRDDIEVTRVIDAPGGDRLGERFPNDQERLNSFDLVIMLDPNLNRITNSYDQLISYMTDRGGGVWILMGEEYSRSAFGNRLETLVPLAVAAPRMQPVRYGKYRIAPDLQMIFHPVNKLAETRDEIISAWNGQPPFTLFVPIDSVRAHAVTLGYVTDENGGAKTPAVAFKRYGAGKILAVAVAPFWHWAFYPVGVGGDASAYREMLSGSIRWLTISDESDRANFKPVKEIFQNGESVAFDGYVRDEGFRPIEGGTGNLTVISTSGDSAISAVTPQPGTSGKYQADVGVLSPGTYRYHAELFADSVRLGRYEGEFAVDDIDRETAFSEVDWTNLAQAALSSRGVFASYRDVQPIIDAVDITQTSFQQTHDIRLWNHLALLVIIISALSVEWFIRKNRQLL